MFLRDSREANLPVSSGKSLRFLLVCVSHVGRDLTILNKAYAYSWI